MSNVDHVYRINEVLSRIHQDITANLDAKTLACSIAYSEQHFHRLFKRVTGEPVHCYIRRTRLEAAANQLVFSPERPIRKIAESCGFMSLSSFTRAFKSIYGVTPGAWRAERVERRGESEKYFLDDPEIREAYQRIKGKPLPSPEIVMLKPKNVAYVRHKGYGRSIREPWEILKAWAMTEERSMDGQIGLHHSNPAWVPLEECRYVACITIDKPIVRRGRVNSVLIPGGLHAAFKLQGCYGELLPYILKMYESWLPASPFGVRTTPAFALYHKNQFLLHDDAFDLTFYLPISLQA